MSKKANDLKNDNQKNRPINQFDFKYWLIGRFYINQFI